MSRILLMGALLTAGPAWAAGGSEGNLALVGGGLAVALGIGAALVFTRRMLGLVYLATFGAFASAYLTVQHYVALHGGESICNINATFNCDLVNTSRFSEIGGVPLAIYGMGYYAALAYVAVRQLLGRSESAVRVLLAGAIGACAFSAYLAWASSTLGAWCLFCISTYVTNLLLLVGAIMEHNARRPSAPWLKAFVDDGGIALVMGLVVFIVSTGVYQNQANGASGGAGSGGGTVSLAGKYEQTRGPVVLDGTEPVHGKADAPVTLVEWADFQCPHCALNAPKLDALVKEHPELKVLFKNYPISGNCNAYVEGPRHAESCTAAVAGECARQQGRFQEMSLAMFANQQYLGPDDLQFIAKQVGLEMAAFDACLKDPAAMDAVKADVEAAATAQIDGTPAMFMKGLWGDQWVYVVGASEAVEAILKARAAGQTLPPPPAPSARE